MTEIFTQINLHENEAPIRTPYQMQRGKREGDWIRGKSYYLVLHHFDALAYGNHSIKPYYKLCPIMQKPFLSLPRVQFFTLNE